MPNNAGTIELVLHALSQAFEPLGELFTIGSLDDLGLGVPAVWQDQLNSSFGALQSAAQALPNARQQLEQAINAGDVLTIIAKGLSLGQKITQLALAATNAATKLQQLAEGDGTLSAAQKANVQQFANEFFPRLLEAMAIRLFEQKLPQLAATANLLGIAEKIPVNVDSADFTAPPHLHRALHLERLVQMVRNPSQYASDLFDFGLPTFDGSKLLTRLKRFLKAFDFPSDLLDPGSQPLILEAFFASLQANQTFNPPALGFELRFPSTQEFQQTIPLMPPWSLTLQFQGTFAAGVQGVIQPPGSFLLQPPNAAPLNFKTGAAVSASRDGSPFLLLGLPGGTRLEAGKLGLGLDLNVVWDVAAGRASASPALSFACEQGKLRIDLQAGDGFVRSAAPSALQADFSLKGDLDLQNGLRLEGTGGVELTVPAHLSLGPLTVEQLYFVAKLGQPKPLTLELSAGLQLQLGPLVASVDRVGANVAIDFVGDGRGNLGPAQFDLGFKPPNGVGLSVDAGPVTGGGFLYFDSDKGEYAGAVELVFSGFLNLKAIGLITTKMPDGSPGFSLLILITAEFGTGIQLGFGFTLLAVGGLLGVNRTIRLDPLVEGVRTGSVNRIMFPRDVIANAPRIISDLRTIFPPQADHFVIGPMAKLGWGTPTLVSISLGVVIEIPPGDIVILGVLRIALPADDVALVVLQINFVGVLEVDKRRLYFFAALFDSRVLFITLTGELGVLMAFGDDANFVLTVGGFHPRFTPPPLPFPTPQRLAINIINESYARIRVEGYFAVTTNSVQFGAHAEAMFGFDDFNVSGNLQFDALFIFSPFHFTISGSSSFSIKVFGMGLYGIGVQFQLEGPAPWRVQGTGSISFLFFDIDVHFHITWGDHTDTLLPPIAVLPILTAELAKDQCWRAELPAGGNLMVTLRPLNPDESGRVLHPVGTLRVSQKSVPLDLTITKVGNQKVSDANRVRLDVQPGSGLQKTDDLMEQFAPAQFRDFADADKLSKPAFEPQHGGIALAGSGGLYATATLTKRSTRYELILLDTGFRSKQRFYGLHAGLLAHWLRGGSAAASALSQTRQAQLTPFKDRVSVGPEAFAVARLEDNRAVSPQAFASEASAQDYLRDQVKSNPSQAGLLHVIPQFEVAS
jgi:hypothetical protein